MDYRQLLRQLLADADVAVLQLVDACESMPEAFHLRTFAERLERAAEVRLAALEVEQ